MICTKEAITMNVRGLVYQYWIFYNKYKNIDKLRNYKSYKTNNFAHRCFAKENKWIKKERW